MSKEKYILNEDFDIPGEEEVADHFDMTEDDFDNETLESHGWEYVASKDVYDKDGFRDAYMWYKNPETGLHRFYFSSDVDYGDPEYYDWESESEENAQEWFDSYSLEDDEEDSNIDLDEDKKGEDMNESVGEKITQEKLRTPRGTFDIYKGSFEDFKNDPEYEGWGMWFEHFLPEDADWKHMTDYYKIMSNGNDAIAVLYMHRDPKPLGESAEDKWVLFRFKSGSNPYIAKDRKETERLLKKYGDKAEKISDRKYIIDDVVEDKFAVEESVRAKFPRGFKLGSHDIQNMIVRNPYNYTIQELRINNRDKTFERGDFSMGRADIELKNKQEYEDIVDLLKDQGYTEVPSDYHSLRNKTRKGVIEDYNKDLGYDPDQYLMTYVNVKGEWKPWGLTWKPNKDLRKRALMKDHLVGNQTVPGYEDVKYAELNKDGTPIEEGISNNMSVEDIAKKHNVSVEDIKAQLRKGIKVEKEHTDDEKKAERIALDHLFEIPDYYDRLDKMEKGALKEEADDLKFIGNAEIISINEFPRIGDSFKKGTVVSINRKPNQEGYRIYEVGVAEDPDHEFVTSDDGDGLDGVNTSHWLLAVKPSLREDTFSGSSNSNGGYVKYNNEIHTNEKSIPSHVVECDRKEVEHFFDIVKDVIKNYTNIIDPDKAVYKYNDGKGIVTIPSAINGDIRNRHGDRISGFDKVTLTFYKEAAYSSYSLKRRSELDKSIMPDTYYYAYDIEIGGDIKLYKSRVSDKLSWKIQGGYGDIEDLKEQLDVAFSKLEELIMDNTARDRYYKNSGYSDARYNMSMRNLKSGNFSTNDAYNLLQKTSQVPYWTDSYMPSDIESAIKEHGYTICTDSRLSNDKEYMLRKFYSIIDKNELDRILGILEKNGVKKEDLDDAVSEDGLFFATRGIVDKYFNQSDVDFVKLLKNVGRFRHYNNESLKEDTIKTKSGKWTNKGKEGTHGTFKTKKEADAQRKAMFSNSGKNRKFGESIDTNKKATKEDILDYAKENGNEYAYNLLLLGGYDFFDGDVDEYDALLKELEDKEDELKESITEDLAENPVDKKNTIRAFYSNQFGKDFHKDFPNVDEMLEFNRTAKDLGTVSYGFVSIPLPDEKYFSKRTDESLKESLTPENGEENFIADNIITAIEDEWKTISLYNNLITILSNESGDKYKDIIPVIQDIVEEENVHVGQLQKALETLSSDTIKIKSGEVEAQGQLEKGEEESIGEIENAVVESKQKVNESWDDDYDDFELAGIYGGDMIYCPICGKRLEYTEDGDQYCSKCGESAWSLAQERRKLDKKNKESNNPDDNIDWYSEDIDDEYPTDSIDDEYPTDDSINPVRRRNIQRRLVNIDREPVRKPTKEDRENERKIRKSLENGSIDDDDIVDYVLEKTPDEMLNGVVKLGDKKDCSCEDDLPDGVDIELVDTPEEPVEEEKKLDESSVSVNVSVDDGKNKVDDTVYGSAEDDEVDIKGI